MKTLKVEVFKSDEAYYSWLDARKAGLRVSKYTPIIVPEDDCTTAHIIVKCKRLDTAIKHAKEAFADYSDVVEALEELERKRAEDKHVTGISDRYNTISTCYNGIDGEYSFYIVVEARDEVAEASEESNPEETETETNEEKKSVKVFEDYESYYLWSEAMEDVPDVSKYIPTIAPIGNILHAQVAIKCDCLSTALREATEIYSEYPAIANAIQKIATKGKASNGGELIHYTDCYDDGCACKTEDGYNIFAKHDTEEESVLASREECHRAMERIFSKINAKSKAELKTRMDTETTEEDETQTETNEEAKEETKMNSTSKKTLDRTAAIKMIFLHLACGGYSDLPRATELYKYLSCDGEIGLTREEIKRYMIENALCDEDSFDYSDEEIADEWFRFADEDEEETEEETETTSETVDESVGNGVKPESEIEEAQSSDDVHETNARLEIVKLKGVKFGTPHLYKSVTGYAFYDAKKGGYWAYSAHRDKHGILIPYTPCGGRETLEKILSDGGFTSFEGMEVVKPLE